MSNLHAEDSPEVNTPPFEVMNDAPITGTFESGHVSVQSGPIPSEARKQPGLMGKFDGFFNKQNEKSAVLAEGQSLRLPNKNVDRPRPPEAFQMQKPGRPNANLDRSATPEGRPPHLGEGAPKRPIKNMRANAERSVPSKAALRGKGFELGKPGLTPARRKELHDKLAHPGKGPNVRKPGSSPHIPRQNLRGNAGGGAKPHGGARGGMNGGHGKAGGAKQGGGAPRGGGHKGGGGKR